MKLNKLLEELNLLDKDGLFSNDHLLKSDSSFLPNRVKEQLLKINPSYIYCINEEPIILFFDNNSDPELEIKIWNFNQAPIIFIYRDNSWIIKNGFSLLEDKSSLKVLTDFDNLTDFEFFKLVSGESFEKYKNDFINRNRVDYYLLDHIEKLRNLLIDPLKGNLHSKIANSLIGRIIFIRYLIDRKVKLDNYGIINLDDFYKLFSDKSLVYKFFEKLKNDFNGNLFPLEYYIDGNLINEKDFINDLHLDYLLQLSKGNKINEDFSIQFSLFNLFDFSIIPIEFISNIYEKFIGVENQEKSGAYYTPLFLVDYIQKETILKYFESNNNFNCKILDPACGSGIFLVESLRQIISQYKIHNPNYLNNYDNYKLDLKNLLLENIYGIDKDENAISVAIFSLYITLLDNLNPKDIVGFQFPDLINVNFFVSDFFDVNHKFNDIFRNLHFQFIIGNPPWATKHDLVKQEFENYIYNRNQNENNHLDIVHREIAEAFLVRVSDFSFSETAFIVVSKILYKLEKQGVFRKYFLNNFLIRQVLELSSVRHHIFDKSNDKAIAPAAVIFYKKNDEKLDLKSNVIKHISLKPNILFQYFKILVIEKNDIKEFTQNYFIEFDWLWKVLVYGNILDFQLVKRLKDDFNTIKEETNNDFISKRGLQKSGKKNKNVSELIGLPFIDTQKKELKKFYIKSSSKWEIKDVSICPPLLVFRAPILLSTKGVDNNFSLNSAISYEDVVFTDSLLAIKAYNNDDVDKLRAISAIWNSKFIASYITLIGSSIGIEREQIHIEEKINIPYVFSQNLIDKYKFQEKLEKEKNESFISDLFLEKEISDNLEEMELELKKLYDFSVQELSLLDYVSKVIIPTLKNKNNSYLFKPLELESEILKDYAMVYINHFGKRFNSNGTFFEVDIILSKYSVLMKFKVIEYPSKFENNIQWKSYNNSQLYSLINKLQYEKLSENLFLRKDIRGFEDDFFYIAKINQYKSWHSSIAYLDILEFIDAINN